MATVSIRVPEDVKERMKAYEGINWSAILRDEIEEHLSRLESRNMAHAVATSERLSQQIDADEVADRNTAEVVRRWRDDRYGEESA